MADCRQLYQRWKDWSDGASGVLSDADLAGEDGGKSACTACADTFKSVVPGGFFASAPGREPGLPALPGVRGLRTSSFKPAALASPLAKSALI